MKNNTLLAAALATVTFGLSTSTFAGIYSIGAASGCQVKLGEAIDLDGIYNPSKEHTISVACPVPMEGTISKVRARLRHAATTNAQSTCFTYSVPKTGGDPGKSDLYFFPGKAGTYDRELDLPDTQHKYGYFEVWCNIVPGDTFYGIRYTN